MPDCSKVFFANESHDHRRENIPKFKHFQNVGKRDESVNRGSVVDRGTLLRLMENKKLH